MKKQFWIFLTIKDFFKKYLPEKNYSRVKRFIRRLLRPLSPLFYAHDLKNLALLHGSDKWGAHYYAQHYEKHFRHLREKRLNILEIGVGGYAEPAHGGASLRMWKYFFPKSRVYSIDIYDKSALQEKRIKIFKGSQADPSFLTDVYKEIGSLDIIIDDGSHINEHVITSFKILFPLLNRGGIYVIEDTQTSYWPQMGGDSENLNKPGTIMTFLKGLTDGLNHKEFIRPGYTPTYFDENIVSVHFYHNMVFIYKGRNDEESNIVKNNTFQKSRKRSDGASPPAQ